MAAHIVLVTGANTGLGFQIIRALAASDKKWTIVLGGRSLDKVDKAIQDIHKEHPSTANQLFPLQVDIENDESIQKAFDEIKARFGRLDALVNNAGAQFDQEHTAGKMTMREMWHRSWDVNTAGTQVLTTIFMPLLLQSADPRLLFITSGTSTLEGTEDQALFVNKSPPKGWPKTGFDITAYRSSKTGMNMMMRQWHRLLKEDGVKIWCIAPGYLATGLGGNQEANKKAGAGDPALGGDFVCKVLEGQRDSDVGKVVSRVAGIQAW